MIDCENCILKSALMSDTGKCYVSCLDLEDNLRKHDKQIRAEALNIDIEKPMHFTDEQKAWVKNYIIINAKRQRADVIEEVKGLAQHYLIGFMDLENATKYGNKNAKQQEISYGSLMRYEIANCVDDFIEAVERLKEQK